MKYLKLFEDYNQYKPNNKINWALLDYPHLEFGYNGLFFEINVDTSELIKYKFIEPNSPMFQYLKSKQFVDDLQEKLFEKDIMEYSAEEIQWIIRKDGLYTNTDIINTIKDKLSNLNIYTKRNKPEFKYFGYSTKDTDALFDYYIEHSAYYSTDELYTQEKYIYITLYYNFSKYLYKYLSDSEIKAITYPYIIEKFNITV